MLAYERYPMLHVLYHLRIKANSNNNKKKKKTKKPKTKKSCRQRQSSLGKKKCHNFKR